jgi:hypothetical protein
MATTAYLQNLLITGINGTVELEEYCTIRVPGYDAPDNITIVSYAFLDNVWIPNGQTTAEVRFEMMLYNDSGKVEYEGATYTFGPPGSGTGYTYTVLQEEADGKIVQLILTISSGIDIGADEIGTIIGYNPQLFGSTNGVILQEAEFVGGKRYTFQYKIRYVTSSTKSSTTLDYYTQKDIGPIYPPTVTLTADDEILRSGECTTLRWTTTGSPTLTTLDNDIGTVNNNGIRTVCPSRTTTYTITTTDGVGLCGPGTDSVTVNLYKRPEITITGPTSIDYGNQATINYSGSNIDIYLSVIPTYSYRNTTVNGAAIVLPTGATVNSSFQTQIPYTEQGPFSVQYSIVATGNGGVETKVINITINIDETPDNLLIPESKDLLKSQDPVITPDPTLTSLKILIEDIDIPIEVSADKPILIDINDQDDWKQVRKTT